MKTEKSSLARLKAHITRELKGFCATIPSLSFEFFNEDGDFVGLTYRYGDNMLSTHINLADANKAIFYIREFLVICHRKEDDK